MARPANRSIDFAPAWLKLPEQAQLQKRHPLDNTQQNPPRSASGGSQQLGNGFQSANHSQPHQTQHGLHSYHSQPGGYGDRYSSQHHQHHQHAHSNPQTAPVRHSRPPLNSYSGGRSTGPQGLLQRSQSTGSYTDSSHRLGSAPASAGDPLDEEFPLLSGGPTISTTRKGTASNTAQWRVKPTVSEQQRSREEAAAADAAHSSDKKLLTSKQPGKVYRAQVKPVRRSNMIPISNGKNAPAKSDRNGRDNSSLSSSVEKEKRLLQEMGWKEEDDSEEDCIIPEQDPEQLQELMMQAKAARERLLQKSKQTLKPLATVTATLPNEDELPSSSDNSDAE